MNTTRLRTERPADLDGRLLDIALDAVRGDDLDRTLQAGCELVSGLLAMELVGVAEALPTGRTLRLVAGTGPLSGLVGASFDAGARSLCAAALEAPGPLAVNDLSSELRRAEPVLAGQGARSGVALALWDGPVRYGVLVAFTTRRRTFGPGDLDVIARVCAVLAAAAAGRHRSDEVQRHGLRDTLTGLPNTVVFGDHLNEALQRRKRYRTTPAVVSIALGGFDELEGTLGRDGANALLVKVAHRLTVSVRAEDTVARDDGHAFLLLCQDVNADGARRLGERIHDVLARPATIHGRPITLPVCVGVALANAANEGPDHLLTAARRAARYGGDGVTVEAPTPAGRP